MIPQIMLQDSTLEEAVDLLRLRASELDVRKQDRERKGINFVIRKQPRSPGDGQTRKEIRFTKR